MGLLGKFAERLITYVYGWAVCHNNPCLFFQGTKFIISLIVFKVCHDFVLTLVINLGSMIERCNQLFHSFDVTHYKISVLSMIVPIPLILPLSNNATFLLEEYQDKYS